VPPDRHPPQQDGAQAGLLHRVRRSSRRLSGQVARHQVPCAQCYGSMPFWCGSGSGFADPCLRLLDPDPAIFIIVLQDANINKKIVKTV
jgi:hypothetical protein